MDPNSYALQWCNTLMPSQCAPDNKNCVDNCKLGIEYAAIKLLDKTINPKSIAASCMNAPGNQVNDTEAFRYGCLLATTFNDPAQNFCTARVKMGDNQYSVPYPCPKSCDSLLVDSKIDVPKCKDAVCQMLTPSYAGGPGVTSGDNLCETPDFNQQYDLLSAARYRPPSYSCASVHPATPNFIGCTVAELQSSMLGYIQNNANN